MKELWLPIHLQFPSWRNVLLAYLTCLFPIQVWSTINTLNEVPAWLVHLSTWDLIGAISYPQVFVLFESVVIFLPLLFLSILLPHPWFMDKFVPLIAGIVFLAVPWFILAHQYDLTIRDWGLRQFFPWIVLFSISQFFFFALIHSSKKIEMIIQAFVDRIAVLSIIYFVLGLISLFIVVVRNI